MSRYSHANRQVRSRSASLVTILAVLTVAACGRGDPTAPAVKTVNPWAVRAGAPCPSEVVMESAGDGRIAADERIRPLGTTEAATSRCRSAQCSASMFATCEPPRSQNPAAVSPPPSSGGRPNTWRSRQ